MGTFEAGLLACLALALSLVSSIAMHPANPFTVAVMVLGLGLLVLATARAARPGATAAVGALARPSIDRGYGDYGAYGGLAICAACAPLQEPAAHAPDWLRAAMGATAVLSLVLLAVHAGGGPRARRAALGTLVGARLALLVAALIAVPHPPIDVWQLQQSAVENLLHGLNPYTTPIDDVYQGRFAFGHQSLYPYPPLNLLLSIPSRALLGDYRYGLVGALAGALWLLRAAGRRRQVAPRTIDLVTFAFVLHPELERLVIHGWTEPYLILALATFLYLHARSPGGVGEAAVMLCTPLLKQYVAVPVILYLALLRPRPRALVAALGVVSLVAAPLLLWNAAATVRMGLLFFVQQVQFRGDSISLPAALHRIHLLPGWEPGVSTALAVQLLVAAAGGWRLRGRGAGGFLLASALSLVAGFLVAPQAFLNYYFLAGTMVLLAVLALAPAATGPSDAPAARSMVRVLAWVGTVAALVAGTSITVRVLDFAVDCSHDGVKARARLAAGGAVLDGGATAAAPGDAIHLCTTTHRLGPLRHEDLLCVCAPAGTASTQIGLWLSAAGRGPASCHLDERHPTADDEQGACRRGRCDEHAERPGSGAPPH